MMVWLEIVRIDWLSKCYEEGGELVSLHDYIGYVSSWQ
jgi:hypothetical protein